MSHLTRHTLLGLSLFMTTTSFLSMLPANGETAGDKKVDTGSATTTGAANKTAKDQSAKDQSSAAGTNDEQKKGHKHKHHGKTADSGEQPTTDKWDSFHKHGTDVGGHNNTDSGFDFQHANEKL
jgi:hypothetical protein